MTELKDTRDLQDRQGRIGARSAVLDVALNPSVGPTNVLDEINRMAQIVNVVHQSLAAS